MLWDLTLINKETTCKWQNNILVILLKYYIKDYKQQKWTLKKPSILISFKVFHPVSVKRRLWTEDCRPGVKCRLQTKGKMQAGGKMLKEPHEGESCFFFLEPRDFITHVTLVQQNRERDWCVNHWFYSTNSAEFRHSAWKIQTWRTMSCRYIWSEPCILLIYCTQLHSVWSLLLFSEMHIRTGSPSSKYEHRHCCVTFKI